MWLSGFMRVLASFNNSKDSLCFELGLTDSVMGLMSFHEMSPRTHYYQIVTKSLLLPQEHHQNQGFSRVHNSLNIMNISWCYYNGI